MDDDSEDEFMHLLQLMLAGEQQGDEFEDELLACVGLVCYGLEEARHNSVLRRSSQRLHLTRPDLLPDPRNDTPWQALYHSQNDRAFITTMGFDVGGKVAGWPAYIRQSSRHFGIEIQQCRAMKM